MSGPIVRQIEFDDAGNPIRITVDMTIDQAGDVASVLGRLRSTDDGWTERTREVWSALSSQVFNRLWEDGLNGWQAGSEVS